MTTIDEIMSTTTVTEVTETTEPVTEAKAEPESMPQEAAPAAEPVSQTPPAVSQADQIIEKLMARIAPPTDVIHRKMFLYGPPGCGKTVLSATAPKPLIVRIEPTGTLSLLNHPDLMNKVQTFEFISIAQLEILIDTITNNTDAFMAACVAKYGWAPETFVVDSLSELQRIDLDTIIAREAAKDADRNKYTRTWPDYNENTIHMAQLAGKLCKLPMNVIVTCHAKDKEDKGKGINITQPSLTDVLAEKCAGFFDIFAYMTCDDEGNRTLQTAPTRTVIAKTRVGKLPAILKDPTWDKLFGHLPTK